MIPKSNHTSVRRAFFPGSFNPFTTGHLSLVERGLQMFDAVVIGVGVSIDKYSEEEIQSRLHPIRTLFADKENVTVVAYHSLTVDAARDNDCCCILRGLRNAADFDYELPMANVNRRLSGIETIFLPALPELSMVSSSMVRELHHFGHDVSEYLP